MPTVKVLDFELLSGIPPGTWVAISEDQERVVGRGLTVEEAIAEGRRNGEKHPYVLRVPEANSALIL